MKLESLHAINLFSYEKLDIEFQHGLHLLRGNNLDENTANGAGKSAIVDIICWAIYGETPRGIKADEIIRWGSDGTASATLTFIKNSINYEIVRTRHPNSLTMLANSVPMVAKDSKELQNKITEIVGFSLNTFLYCVYFSQNASLVGEFLFANDSTKKEILTEILGLNTYDDCLYVAKTKLKSAEMRFVQVQTELDMKKTEVVQKNKLIEKYACLSHSFQDQIKSDLAMVETTIKNANAEIDRVSGIMAIYDNPGQKIEQNTIKLKQIGLLIPRIDADLAKFNKDIVLSENKITTLHSERDRYTKMVSDMETMLSNQYDTENFKCEKCLQPLSRERMLQRQTEMLCDLDAIVGQSVAERARCNELVLNRDTLCDKKNKLMRLDKDLTESNRALEMEYRRVHDNYQVVSTTQKKVLEDAEKSKQTILSRTNNYETLKIQAESDKSHLEYEIDLWSSNGMDLGYEKSALEALVLAFGRSGIRAMIFESAMGELSSYVSEYVSQLFVGDIKVTFVDNINKAGIQSMVLWDGKEININLLSGGQRRRLLLATNFALSRLIANRIHGAPNFICLDECFNGLDASGKEKVMEFLKLMTPHKDFIWVIDHATELQESFDSIYDIELSNGKSRLIYGAT